MKDIDRFHQGKYNVLNQLWQPDGSVKLLMKAKGIKMTYKLRLKNINKPGEQEVDYDSGQPIG